jgi:hypothetical protein
LHFSATYLSCVEIAVWESRLCVSWPMRPPRALTNTNCSEWFPTSSLPYTKENRHTTENLSGAIIPCNSETCQYKVIRQCLMRPSLRPPPPVCPCPCLPPAVAPEALVERSTEENVLPVQGFPFSPEENVLHFAREAQCDVPQYRTFTSQYNRGGSISSTLARWL